MQKKSVILRKKVIPSERDAIPPLIHPIDTEIDTVTNFSRTVDKTDQMKHLTEMIWFQNHFWPF